MAGDLTPNLKLPYILAAQAQKHVTHNEAIRALDALLQLTALDRGLAAPPGSPADGDRYIVAAGASGAWAGKTAHIAAFQDGAWAFYPPEEGWVAWVADEDIAVVFDGSGWTALGGGGGGGGLANVVEDTTPQLGGQLDVNGFALGDGTLELLKFSETASAVNEVTIANAATAGNPTISATGDDTNITLALAGKGTGGVRGAVLGVNANADTTNRLSVSSAAALFNHAGAGHQVKVNKSGAGDTASFLFQTGFSGRAEIGTTGDDDFHFKVSPDGSAYVEALILNKTMGAITHKAGARSTFAHDATNAGVNLIPAAGDPSAPSNGDLWYNSSTGKFRKREAGATSDLDTTGGGGGGGGTHLLLGSDVSNSTTTLANVTGLSFTASANTTYLVCVRGAFQSASTTTGIALTFDIPSGSIVGHNLIAEGAPGFNSMNGVVITGDDTTNGAGGAVQTVNTNTPISAWAIIAVGGTGGTVQLRFRSEVAASAVTMKANLTLMSYEQVS